MGDEEVRLAKRNYGWPQDKKFYVPEGVYDHFRQGFGKRGKGLCDAWFERIAEYRKQYPELAEELFRMQHRQLPEGWDCDLPEFPADPKGLATRESSAKVLNAAAKNTPWLIGGSPDLAPSTKTRLTFEGAGDFSAAAAALRCATYRGLCREVPARPVSQPNRSPAIESNHQLFEWVLPPLVICPFRAHTEVRPTGQSKSTWTKP